MIKKCGSVLCIAHVILQEATRKGNLKRDFTYGLEHVNDLRCVSPNSEIHRIYVRYKYTKYATSKEVRHNCTPEKKKKKTGYHIRFLLSIS